MFWKDRRPVPDATIRLSVTSAIQNFLPNPTMKLTTLLGDTGRSGRGDRSLTVSSVTNRPIAMTVIGPEAFPSPSAKISERFVRERSYEEENGLMGLMPFLVSLAVGPSHDQIVTVKGPIPAHQFAPALPHEHILCDFIGAKDVRPSRYDRGEVIAVMEPFLKDLHQRGFNGFVDCTPAYIGRDPILLRELAERTDLAILTNTGYYGAAGDRYLPEHAFNETAEQLAGRWIREWEEGIDGTRIKPGFIKIGVDPGPLSPVDRKLVEAAVLTHRKTGLTIACHTGERRAAEEVLTIVLNSGLDPSSLIIVHADSVGDVDGPIGWAKTGAWVELDAVGARPIPFHLDWLGRMKKEGLLRRILISHDAGWYWVGEARGGKEKIRPFTFIADRLIPELRRSGFDESEIDLLVRDNSIRAFTPAIRLRD